MKKNTSLSVQRRLATLMREVAKGFLYSQQSAERVLRIKKIRHSVTNVLQRELARRASRLRLKIAKQSEKLRSMVRQEEMMHICANIPAVAIITVLSVS